MYVVLDVKTPKKLSREQKKLLEQLAKTSLDDDNDFRKIEKYL